MSVTSSIRSKGRRYGRLSLSSQGKSEVKLLGVMGLSKYFIESYETDEEALRQIERLKEEGYSESDMYVITQHDDQLSIIKGKTNVDNYAEEGNWLDRFTSFLTGNKQAELAFQTMEISKAEEEKYYNELKAGRLVLYVNKDYEGRFREAGGDSFQLGEKDKAELHNRKEKSGAAPPAGIDEEETVELDDHRYADGDSTDRKR